MLGQVEGVHVHAMALDNLIELGPDYYRYGKPPVKETPEFTTGDLAEVLIFGIFAFGAFYFGEFYGRAPSEEEEEEAALAASEAEEPRGPVTRLDVGRRPRWPPGPWPFDVERTTGVGSALRSPSSSPS